MNDKSQILNRIKEYNKFNTDTELADFLGINRSTLSNWIKRNSIDYDLVFSKCEEIDKNWLLTGQRQMLNKGANDNQITQIHKPTKYMEKTEETQEITLYDISAAANLKTLFTEKEQNILGKITLPNVPRCDGALYVRGDSMDPLIKSGDIVCYKEIYQLNRIIYGEMYLVSMDIEGDEYLTIKYVFPSDKGDGFVRLESFNKRHSPEDFEIKYITALALVKISIRMNTLI